MTDLEIAATSAVARLRGLLAQLHLRLRDVVSLESRAKALAQIEHALVDGELPGRRTHCRQDSAGGGVKLDRCLAAGIEPFSRTFDDRVNRNRYIESRLHLELLQ